MSVNMYSGYPQLAFNFSKNFSARMHRSYINTWSLLQSQAATITINFTKQFYKSETVLIPVLTVDECSKVIVDSY